MIEDKGAWINGNWKYLVIAGALILVAFCIILGLAIFFRRRKGSERMNQQLRLIPLRNLGRPRPKSAGGESTVPLRPLRPTTHNFPAHLRMYAQDMRKKAAKRAEKAAMAKREADIAVGLGEEPIL